jgi:hypothetical protein
MDEHMFASPAAEGSPARRRYGAPRAAGSSGREEFDVGRLIGVLVAAAALAGLVLSVPAARADWSGDGHADVLAVDPGERLSRQRRQLAHRHGRADRQRVRHKTVSRRFVICR